MTAVLLLAAAAALGVVHLVRLAAPPAPRLLRQTARWDQARAGAGRRPTRQFGVAPGDATSPVVGPTAGGRGSTVTAAGRWDGAVAQGPGWDLMGRAAAWAADRARAWSGARLPAVEADLAVTGRTLEGWLTWTLGVALVGFLSPWLLVAVFAAAGVDLPVSWALPAGVGLTALMVVLAMVDLRAEARARREEFTRALSIYLDLVVMSMEAGRGHAEALPAAAGVGAGWAFTDLQDAIDGARVAGITPWQSLGRVGERYGIAELVDLRSTLTLAQDDGARIRSTLIARAATMRETRLAEAQARAGLATESMRTTIVLMAMVVAAYIVVPPLLRLLAS